MPVPHNSPENGTFSDDLSRELSRLQLIDLFNTS